MTQPTARIRNTLLTISLTLLFCLGTFTVALCAGRLAVIVPPEPQQREMADATPHYESSDFDRLLARQEAQ